MENNKQKEIPKGNITNKVAAYILVFFTIFIIVFLSIFYLRDNFRIEPEALWAITDDEDADLRQALIDKQREIDEYRAGVGTVELINPSCNIGDVEYVHGTEKVFFSRSVVGPYEKCEQFQKVRFCDNGIWNGDSKYKFEVCKVHLDCSIDDELTLEDGQRVSLYSRDSVPFGDSCDNYKRERQCVRSVLDGDSRYIFRTCSVAMEGVCEIDGNFLGNASQRYLYSTPEVSYLDDCSDYAQPRTCSSGVLNGDEEFKYWQCLRAKPRKCVVDGLSVDHGQTQVFYSKLRPENGKTCSFYSEEGVCDDGTMKFEGFEDGTFKYASCGYGSGG